uniref:Uncharacterized protein n=1 Tax=Arundo donax TaxID=35708 RepID=A0A0A9BZS4_ARUDO
MRQMRASNFRPRKVLPELFNLLPIRFICKI